eukprot:TRINITY_DN11855_c0_g1_i2.p1 TRINITY_DN11855_c0_g1~~TRINITY_DN11855_c0_g1_i2.p1  ORF type:complete len:522 (+),score=114.63 TRINITY_DN11855_c0_g1_i2:114-1679(+)
MKRRPPRSTLSSSSAASDVYKRQIVHRVEGFKKEVISGDFAPTTPYTVVLASNDRQVAMFRGQSMKEMWWREEMDVLTRQARFSPDGEFLILAGAGKCVIYYTDSGERAGELPREHDGTIGSVCWSPDSTRVLSASCDQTVKMWDVASQSCIETFKFSECADVTRQQLGVVWGEAAMISAGLDGNLNVLDLQTPPRATVIPGLCAPIEAMVVEHTTGIIYAGATCDGECKVVGYKPASSIENLYGAGVGAFSCVTGQGPAVGITGISVNAGKMVVVSLDGKLSVADVTDPSYPHYTTQVGGLEMPTKQCVVTSEGVVCVATATQLALHDEVESRHLLEPSCFQQVCNVETEYTPLSMALSPDEATLAVSTDLTVHRGSQQSIHLYSLTASSIEPLFVIPGTKSAARALSFSPDGNFLAAGDDNREVRFYNCAEHWAAEIEDYTFHGSQVSSLTWHPTGDCCVSGAIDRGIVVHKIGRLKNPAVFERANVGAIQHVEFFSEDLFVAGGADGTLTTYEFKKCE